MSTLIRMKHPDPNASISISVGEPDALGGVMIPIEQVEDAKSHGYIVLHLHEEEAQASLEQDESPAAEEATNEASEEATEGAEGTVTQNPMQGRRRGNR